MTRGKKYHPRKQIQIKPNQLVKAVSVLRDDVKTLLHHLLDIMNQMELLLHDIHQHNSQLHYFIKTENHNAITELVDENNDTFDSLSELKFEENSTKEALAAILGIDFDMLSKRFEEENIPIWKEIHATQTSIYNLMESAFEQNNDIVEKMEKMKSTIQSDIRDMQVTLKWYKKKEE